MTNKDTQENAVNGLNKLFELADALENSSSNEGCDADLTVVGSAQLWNLLQHIRQLKAVAQAQDTQAQEMAENVVEQSRAFVKRIASLKKWGEPDENGNSFEPSDGLDDSHSCLMDLIDEARGISGALAGGALADMQHPALKIVKDVCNDFDGNGIFSVGAIGALRAMAHHWKDHLAESHGPRIISEDIDEMAKMLEVMRAEIMRRITLTEKKMDAKPCKSLVINAPEFFKDPAFMAWLNNGRPKFTWHIKGNVVSDEYSDVVVCVDPSLNGEGIDSDMPQYIWNKIVEVCRQYIGPRSGEYHYMVRITNLDV